MPGALRTTNADLTHLLLSEWVLGLCHLERKTKAQLVLVILATKPQGQMKVDKAG